MSAGAAQLIASSINPFLGPVLVIDETVSAHPFEITLGVELGAQGVLITSTDINYDLVETRYPLIWAGSIQDSTALSTLDNVFEAFCQVQSGSVSFGYTGSWNEIRFTVPQGRIWQVHRNTSGTTSTSLRITIREKSSARTVAETVVYLIATVQ